MAKTFQCYQCGETNFLDADWTEEKQHAEHETRFGVPVPEDAVKVCDRCYEYFLERLKHLEKQ